MFSSIFFSMRFYLFARYQLMYNTYCGYASLVLQGSSESILNKEGVGQSDPPSMLMYAATLTPLIASLKDLNNWSQCWFSDDSACAAKLPKLREWFDDVCKLWITVVAVDEVDEAEANACFCDLGVKVVRGQRYLGGFILGSRWDKEFC